MFLNNIFFSNPRSNNRSLKCLFLNDRQTISRGFLKSIFFFSDLHGSSQGFLNNIFSVTFIPTVLIAKLFKICSGLKRCNHCQPLKKIKISYVHVTIVLKIVRNIRLPSIRIRNVLHTSRL